MLVHTSHGRNRINGVALDQAGRRDAQTNAAETKQNATFRLTKVFQKPGGSPFFFLSVGRWEPVSRTRHRSHPHQSAKRSFLLYHSRHSLVFFFCIFSVKQKFINKKQKSTFCELARFREKTGDNSKTKEREQTTGRTKRGTLRVKNN